MACVPSQSKMDTSSVAKAKGKKFKTYSTIDLESAIDAYLDGTEMRIVRQRFPTVPERTIYGRAALRRKQLELKKPGPPPVLGPEREAELEKWIIAEQALGRRITRDIVRRKASEMLSIQSSANSISNDSSSNDATTSEDRRDSQVQGETSPTSSSQVQRQTDETSPTSSSQTASSPSSSAEGLSSSNSLKLTQTTLNSVDIRLGLGWFNRFMRRHPNLSLRNTSPPVAEQKSTRNVEQPRENSSNEGSSNSGSVGECSSTSPSSTGDSMFSHSMENSSTSFTQSNEQQSTSSPSSSSSPNMNPQLKQNTRNGQNNSAGTNTNSLRQAKAKRKHRQSKSTSKSPQRNNVSPRAAAAAEGIGELVANGSRSTAKHISSTARRRAQIQSNFEHHNLPSAQSFLAPHCHQNKQFQSLPSRQTMYSHLTTARHDSSNPASSGATDNSQSQNASPMIQDPQYSNNAYVANSENDVERQLLEMEKLRCEVEERRIRVCVERALARKRLIDSGISPTEADEILSMGSMGLFRF